MCDEVNEPKGSSYIESPKWLKYENATINPKNIDYSYFQYAFALKEHHKKIKNHLERVSNIKPYLDLDNWSFIEYPTTIHKNNYTLCIIKSIMRKLL